MTCDTLRARAIAAAQQAEAQAQERVNQHMRETAKAAYAQFKPIFEDLTITGDGMKLELCGDVFEPQRYGFSIEPGYSDLYWLVAPNGHLVNDLASYGRFLLNREEEQWRRDRGWSWF